MSSDGQIRQDQSNIQQVGVVVKTLDQLILPSFLALRLDESHRLLDVTLILTHCGRLLSFRLSNYKANHQWFPLTICLEYACPSMIHLDAVAVLSCVAP